MTQVNKQVKIMAKPHAHILIKQMSI